jgi:ABC-2 type transport system ATP-binding protein
VDGLNLVVKQGEVVGFIGPNGAGKTTTIKALLGFIFPIRGTARVFGLPAGSREAKRRIGYLPEVALYYPFMKTRELLNIYGGVIGYRGKTLRNKVDEVIELVGLKGRDRELLKKYSKGMLQRVGIAQALLGNPDVLILDEVTSGLDPVGRRDLRCILQQCQEQGKTVFFSSHELSEVALICDRVILINDGKVIEKKKIADLMADLHEFDITIRSTSEITLDGKYRVEKIKDDMYKVSPEGGQTTLDVMKELIRRDYEIMEFGSAALSLEDYFVKKVGRKIS